MKVITELNQLSSLMLPESITVILRKTLLQPFDNDETEMMMFWRSTDVRLFYLTAEDFPDNIDRVSRELFVWAATIPEFVIQLTRDCYLMLAVTGDDGGGIYILFHPDCPVEEIRKLTEIAEPATFNE